MINSLQYTGLQLKVRVSKWAYVLDQQIISL